MSGHRQLARIEPIPAFRDNYIWWIRNAAQSAVVDPGEAAPVLERLRRTGSSLHAIVLTHHHGDHTGGVLELVRETGAQVYGPAHEAIAGVDVRLSEGDTVELGPLNLSLAVLDVPAHTAGHIAYLARPAGQPPMLFCGDSLFSCGCGRLREGSPAQLLRVMHTFSALEPATVVYCTHEYTLDNIEFALSVEPDNLDLHAWKTRALALRTDGAPTLPTTIAHELAVNPFLRTRVESVKAGVARYLGVPVSSLSELDVMTALRRWKDVFKSAPTPSAAPSHSRSQ